MQKKFSYPLKIDELNQREYTFDINANQNELDVIKGILQVVGVKTFQAKIHLKLNLREHLLKVWGNVCANLELQSVVSLKIFAKTYQTDFELNFDTKATYRDIREIDDSINSDVPDIIENGQIDLADIALEQIALQMEDYPRDEGEVFDFSLYATKDENKEDIEHPFAALAKLKK